MLPSLPRPLPERVTLSGRFVRLEALAAERHGAELFAACTRPGSEPGTAPAERFRFLAEAPPTPGDFPQWLARAESSSDPLYFAVIDAATGRCEGRQALMRMAPEHGVIEIGSILWNPPLAGSRAATEALFLMADYVFDALGYRRLEWKCDALNVHSRRAAARFGFAFEGVFRQHMVVKGLNRDTAWFAILDGAWPRLRAGYREWLVDDNFDAAGRQLRRLGDCLPSAT